MAGANSCGHCGSTLQALVFDATGRVTTKLRNRVRSVPIFPAYSVADAQAGMTAPAAMICPACDAPDDSLTLDRLAQHLRLTWNVETFQQPESD